MSFFSEIADKLVHDAHLESLSAAQCEAVIDVLALTLYADDEANVLERAEFEQLLHRLPLAFDDHTLLDAKAGAAILRAESITDDAGRLEALAGISRVLTDAGVRRRVLKMCAQLAFADFEANPAEHRIITMIGESFEVPKPFIDAILHDAMGEAHPTEAAAAFDGDLGEVDLDDEDPNAGTLEGVISNDFLGGFFADLYDTEELQHLNEHQAFAFVDALTLALVADGYPEDEELEEFKIQLERLPLSAEDVPDLAEHVERTIEDLRGRDAAGVQAFANELGAKIPSARLREQALRMAISVTHADFAITDEEARLIRVIAAGLRVHDDRAQSIVDEVRSSSVDDMFA